MKSYRFMLALLLALLSLPSAAQDDVIHTIKVKRSAPPDTGRYTIPPSWDIYDGFPRPMCCFRSSPPRRHVYFIAGYEYRTYSYLKLGVRSANPFPFQTYVGAVIQGNIDHNIIGAGVFAEKRLLTLGSGTCWAGFRASSFMENSGDFHTIAPYVSLNIDRFCLDDLHLSYGYNFVMANNISGPEGLERPAPRMNTHNFTITYIFPFYL